MASGDHQAARMAAPRLHHRGPLAHHAVRAVHHTRARAQCKAVLRAARKGRRIARQRIELGIELWVERGLHPVASIARVPRTCSISGFSAASPRYSRDFTVDSGARVTLAISSNDISSWKRSVSTSR